MMMIIAVLQVKYVPVLLYVLLYRRYVHNIQSDSDQYQLTMVACAVMLLQALLALSCLTRWVYLRLCIASLPPLTVATPTAGHCCHSLSRALLLSREVLNVIIPHAFE
jgi:hypothetical protein